MPNAYAIAMTNPHEVLGLPQPLGRRLPHGLMGWNLALMLATLICGVIYVVEVNAAAVKGYRLEQAQKRVDTLQTEILSIQTKAVSVSSLQQLTTRAAELGMKPVDSIQYLNAAAKSYAYLAK